MVNRRESLSHLPKSPRVPNLALLIVSKEFFGSRWRCLVLIIVKLGGESVDERIPLEITGCAPPTTPTPFEFVSAWLLANCGSDCLTGFRRDVVDIEGLSTTVMLWLLLLLLLFSIVVSVSRVTKASLRVKSTAEPPYRQGSCPLSASSRNTGPHSSLWLNICTLLQVT